MGLLMNQEPWDTQQSLGTGSQRERSAPHWSRKRIALFYSDFRVLLII